MMTTNDDLNLYILNYTHTHTPNVLIRGKWRQRWCGTQLLVRTISFSSFDMTAAERRMFLMAFRIGDGDHFFLNVCSFVCRSVGRSMDDVLYSTNELHTYTSAVDRCRPRQAPKRRKISLDSLPQETVAFCNPPMLLICHSCIIALNVKLFHHLLLNGNNKPKNINDNKKKDVDLV